MNYMVAGRFLAGCLHWKTSRRAITSIHCNAGCFSTFTDFREGTYWSTFNIHQCYKDWLKAFVGFYYAAIND